MIFGLTFSGRWTQIPRHVLPALVTIVLLIVQILPWSRSADAMTPSFVLMSLFFWSLRAPSLLPPLFACAIGIAADLTELTPLGSQALLFLALGILLQRHRRLGELSFLQLWVLFAGACLAVNTALWLIEIMVGLHLMPPGQAIERSAIAAALYPLIAVTILLPAERIAKDING